MNGKFSKILRMAGADNKMSRACQVGDMVESPAKMLFWDRYETTRIRKSSRFHKKQT